MGKHKKQSPKEYKKQRQMSNGINKSDSIKSFDLNQSLPVVYICFMCQSDSNKPIVYISKRNRSIMYFVCSEECYIGIKEHY